MAKYFSKIISILLCLSLFVPYLTPLTTYAIEVSCEEAITNFCVDPNGVCDPWGNKVCIEEWVDSSCHVYEKPGSVIGSCETTPPEPPQAPEPPEPPASSPPPASSGTGNYYWYCDGDTIIEVDSSGNRRAHTDCLALGGGCRGKETPGYQSDAECYFGGYSSAPSSPSSGTGNYYWYCEGDSIIEVDPSGWKQLHTNCLANGQACRGKITPGYQSDAECYSASDFSTEPLQTNLENFYSYLNSVPVGSTGGSDVSDVMEGALNEVEARKLQQLEEKRVQASQELKQEIVEFCYDTQCDSVYGKKVCVDKWKYYFEGEEGVLIDKIGQLKTPEEICVGNDQPVRALLNSCSYYQCDKEHLKDVCIELWYEEPKQETPDTDPFFNKPGRLTDTPCVLGPEAGQAKTMVDSCKEEICEPSIGQYICIEEWRRDVDSWEGVQGTVFEKAGAWTGKSCGLSSQSFIDSLNNATQQKKEAKAREQSNNSGSSFWPWLRVETPKKEVDKNSITLTQTEETQVKIKGVLDWAFNQNLEGKINNAQAEQASYKQAIQDALNVPEAEKAARLKKIFNLPENTSDKDVMSMTNKALLSLGIKVEGGPADFTVSQVDCSDMGCVPIYQDPNAQKAMNEAQTKTLVGAVNLVTGGAVDIGQKLVNHLGDAEKLQQEYKDLRQDPKLEAIVDRAIKEAIEEIGKRYSYQALEPEAARQLLIEQNNAQEKLIREKIQLYAEDYAQKNKLTSEQRGLLLGYNIHSEKFLEEDKEVQLEVAAWEAVAISAGPTGKAAAGLLKGTWGRIIGPVGDFLGGIVGRITGNVAKEGEGAAGKAASDVVGRVVSEITQEDKEKGAYFLADKIKQYGADFVDPDKRARLIADGIFNEDEVKAVLQAGLVKDAEGGAAVSFANDEAWNKGVFETASGVLEDQATKKGITSEAEGAFILA
ncbi:MAG: hypothetical protein V1808_03440, partial [Candidatus Daviesbacteria bacterium]